MSGIKQTVTVKNSEYSKSHTCKSPEKFYKYWNFLVTTFPKILQVSGIQPTVTVKIVNILSPRLASLQKFLQVSKLPCNNFSKRFYKCQKSNQLSQWKILNILSPTLASHQKILQVLKLPCNNFSKNFTSVWNPTNSHNEKFWIF